MINLIFFILSKILGIKKNFFIYMLIKATTIYSKILNVNKQIKLLVFNKKKMGNIYKRKCWQLMITSCARITVIVIPDSSES